MEIIKGNSNEKQVLEGIVREITQELNKVNPFVDNLKQIDDLKQKNNIEDFYVSFVDTNFEDININRTYTLPQDQHIAAIVPHSNNQSNYKADKYRELIIFKKKMES